MCSTVLSRPILALLRDRGHDLNQLAIESGIEGELLTGTDCRVASRNFAQLLNAARELSGDPLLGLHAPSYLNPGDFDLLEYVAACCKNAGAAIEAAERYLHLLNDALNFSLSRQRDPAIWSCTTPDPAMLPPLAADYVIAAITAISRRYGREIRRYAGIGTSPKKNRVT